MKPFENRVLLGWINDISSVPKWEKRWPIIDIDPVFVKDFKEYIDVIKEWGYTGFTLWGLFVSHNWPVDLKSCLDSERRKYLKQMLEYARKKGVAVYAGLGAYSWGFEEIIKADPSLIASDQRKSWGHSLLPNDCVMCYQKEEARAWMRRIIDFIVEETDIDGFGIQAADQGRCICAQCSELEDTEYYAAISGETAQYIKGKWPEKLVSVSGWGMSFQNEASMPALEKLSRQVDYITDVSETVEAGEKRKSLINRLDCAFGTVGGVIVVPPQRWNRLRWFLPHLAVNGNNAKLLAADGGRAFEYFAGPLANPGEEVSLKATGFLLNRPDAGFHEAMEAAVESTFRPVSDGACQNLAGLLLRAEETYFSHLPWQGGGEFDFEPLQCVEPGEPVYLLGRSREQLLAYKRELVTLQREFSSLTKQVKREDRLQDVSTAMTNVIREVDGVLQMESMS